MNMHYWEVDLSWPGIGGSCMDRPLSAYSFLKTEAVDGYTENGEKELGIYCYQNQEFWK